MPDIIIIVYRHLEDMHTREIEQVYGPFRESNSMNALNKIEAFYKQYDTPQEYFSYHLTYIKLTLPNQIQP